MTTKAKVKHSSASIEARVKDILADNLGRDVEELTSDSNLREDLGADSLDIIEAAMGLEEEFAISIDDADTEDLGTVGDVIRHVKRKLGFRQ